MIPIAIVVGWVVLGTAILLLLYAHGERERGDV